MKSVTLSIDQYLFRRRFSKTITRKVAESWNELTLPVLERIVYLFYQENAIHVTKLLCLKAVLGLSWTQYFLFKSEFTKLFQDADGELITFIDYITAWLFKGFGITSVPYKKLGKYFGPKDYLDDMTTEEFVAADHHFHQYLKTTDEHHLNCLVAVMYRLPGEEEEHNPNSRKFRGDLREPFNDATVEKRANLMKKISETRRLVVLSFYRSCRQIWEQQFDHVFTKESEEMVKSRDYGWFEALKAVSADDFGTIDMKEKVPIGNIFLSMQIDIRDAKKLKAQR